MIKMKVNKNQNLISMISKMFQNNFNNILNNQNNSVPFIVLKQMNRFQKELQLNTQMIIMMLLIIKIINKKQVLKMMNNYQYKMLKNIQIYQQKLFLKKVEFKCKNKLVFKLFKKLNSLKIQVIISKLVMNKLVKVFNLKESKYLINQYVCQKQLLKKMITMKDIIKIQKELLIMLFSIMLKKEIFKKKILKNYMMLEMAQKMLLLGLENILVMKILRVLQIVFSLLIQKIIKIQKIHYKVYQKILINQNNYSILNKWIKYPKKFMIQQKMLILILKKLII